MSESTDDVVFARGDGVANARGRSKNVALVRNIHPTFARRHHDAHRGNVQPYLSGLRFPRASFSANAAVPTRPRSLVRIPGTPRGSATHEAVRDIPAEGFVFGTSPARDSVGGVRARRRDVSPGVRVGDRPFVHHPDPRRARRARRLRHARPRGAGASEARHRARLAWCLHVADTSGPPRGGAALGRRARLAGRRGRGRRLELRRKPVDGFVPRRFRRAERLLARGRGRVRGAAGQGGRWSRVARASGGRPRRVPEPRRARARPGRRKIESRRRTPRSRRSSRPARARRGRARLRRARGS